MVLGFIHDAICSTVFHAALLYATSIALQQRVRTTDSKGRPDRVRVGVRALKLWIMIMSIAAVSALGADALPLFTEMKIITTFLLVLAPTFTQQEIYDRLFAPLLESASVAFKSVTSSQFLMYRGGWWATNGCVYAGVGITNFMYKHGVISEDEMKDIQSGLVFTRRALQDVMARYLAQHPEEKPSRAASLRLSGAKHVYATSSSEVDEAENGQGNDVFASPFSGSPFGKAEVFYTSHNSKSTTVSAAPASSDASSFVSQGTAHVTRNHHSLFDMNTPPNSVPTALQGEEESYGNASESKKKKKFSLFRSHRQ